MEGFEETGMVQYIYRKPGSVCDSSGVRRAQIDVSCRALGR